MNTTKTKHRHNKKRNTAFLFEALIKEMAKCVLKKDADRQRQVAQIIKQHFAKGTALYEELQAFRAINETTGVTPEVARRIVAEAKRSSDKINKKELFNEQSSVIRKINHSLGSGVYSNFVTNYKNLANISQLFSDSGSIRKRVLLEEKIIESMSEQQDTPDG